MTVSKPKTFKSMDSLIEHLAEHPEVTEGKVIVQLGRKAGKTFLVEELRKQYDTPVKEE